MSRPRLRPELDLVYPHPPDAAVRALQRAVDAPGSLCVAKFRGRHVQITVRQEDRHFWSPWLAFEAKDHDDGVELQGRFAPQPAVWTFFMVIYATCAFTALGFGVFGLARITLGLSSWPMWVSAGSAFAGAGAYLAGFVGQGLGAEQTLLIRDFIGRAVRDAEDTSGAPKAATASVAPMQESA